MVVSTSSQQAVQPAQKQIPEVTQVFEPVRERDPDLELLKTNYKHHDAAHNQQRIVQIVDAYEKNGKNIAKTKKYLD